MLEELLLRGPIQCTAALTLVLTVLFCWVRSFIKHVADEEGQELYQEHADLQRQMHNLRQRVDELENSVREARSFRRNSAPTEPQRYTARTPANPDVTVTVTGTTTTGTGTRRKTRAPKAPPPPPPPVTPPPTQWERLLADDDGIEEIPTKKAD